MRAADRAPRLGLVRSEDVLQALPLNLADPAGLIQRALGGFPTGFCCAEQIVLAWLMTLPPDVDPPRAARSLLTGRLPSCRPDVSPATDAMRDLLCFIAAHDLR